MRPIVKKALAAVAAKEIYERVQESRRPQKPSFGARLFKLGLFAALVGGAYYAYKSGLLGGSRDRYGSDTYDGSLSYQGPREDLVTETDPVGTPTT